MNLRRYVVAVLVVVALAGCGAPAQLMDLSRRPLPGSVLARKAVAYSGYRTGQSPDLAIYPSEAQIQEDLQLLVRGGWGVIRVFDSGPHAERVLAVIRAQHLDLKVMLGIWIAGGKAEHDAANRAEIERGVGLAQQYAETVVAVSIGNETLDDWSNVRTPTAELAAYISEVRGRIRQPVTTDDSWLPFTLVTDGKTSYEDVINVIQVVDFLSVHVYPSADAYYGSWPWQQEAVPAEQRAQAMMDAALAYAKESVRAVRTTLAGRGLELPIVIGEWGWKSATKFTIADAPEQAIERFFAHPMNQKIFYEAVMAWVYGAARDADRPDAAFYFEAFDEPWKDGDDHWGLFDVERRPKYLMWGLYPDLKPADAVEPKPSDAVHYSAP
jgi:exo-beta-1,3-glucanase (GH17 family)